MLTEIVARVRKHFWPVVCEKNLRQVNEKLREITVRDGLGVALLVAWQHGLESGHIPTRVDGMTEKEMEPRRIGAQSLGTSPFQKFVFAHIPIRALRGNTKELIARKIMNPNPDPVDYIYHEDGIIGDFSFTPDTAEHRKWLQRALVALEAQRVLVGANAKNRQIQFKDSEAKKKIENAAKLYVKGIKPVTAPDIWWPSAGSPNETRTRQGAVVKAIERKQQCNYCSVQALNPKEATIHVTNALGDLNTPDRETLKRVRNYQMGFTFAPFGPPESACHFLAWDFPHVNDVVNNMDRLPYSFGDLIKLVRVINKNIEDYCRRCEIQAGSFLCGACNHWAGNTIYHQHYQFFHLPDLPLAQAPLKGPKIADWRSASVSRLDWPAPAYVITSETTSETNSDDDVVRLAESMAEEWINGNREFVEPFGNGIRIADRTQNTFVTIQDGHVRAIFIPRVRKGGLSASFTGAEGVLRKENAAVLEMMGYFLVDAVEDYRSLEKMSEAQRCDVAVTWLRSLSPDENEIKSFEEEAAKRLRTPVFEYRSRIEDAGARESAEEAFWRSWEMACELVTSIRADNRLDERQKALLLAEENEKWMQKWNDDTPVIEVSASALATAAQQRSALTS